MRNFLIKLLIGNRPVMMNMDITSNGIKLNKTVESAMFNGNILRNE